jgi:hypothetical protein
MKRAAGSVLLALVLMIAIQSIWGLLVLWSGTLVKSLWSSESERGPFDGESIQFLKDGTPIVLARTTVRGVDHVAYRTLDGRSLDKVKMADFHLSGPLIPESALTSRGRSLRWRDRIRRFAFLRLSGGGHEGWYVVSDPDGGTRFVGYDFRTQRALGYLGRSGFRETPPPAEDRFPLARGFLAASQVIGGMSPELPAIATQSDGPLLFLPLSDEVVAVDLGKRTVTSVAKEAAIDADRFDPHVEVADLVHVGAIKWNQWEKAVLRTSTHLRIVGADRNEKFAVEIPERLRDEPLQATEYGKRGVMVVTRNDYHYPPLVHIAWLTVDGPPKIVDVPLDNPSGDVPEPWPAIGLLLPQSTALVAGWLINSFQPTDREETTLQQPTTVELWSRFWPTLFVVVFLSVFLAAAAWRGQRRYGLGQQAVWAVFVLLFGVPGWLGYLWHRRWPPLEACPKCGAMAPRDRETCFRCGTPFPPPTRESFEIRD